MLLLLLNTQVIRKQCSTKGGKSKIPFSPLFEFSKGESLIIPTDFSTVTGWCIYTVSTVKVMITYVRKYGSNLLNSCDRYEMYGF